MFEILNTWKLIPHNKTLLSEMHKLIELPALLQFILNKIKLNSLLKFPANMPFFPTIQVFL